MRADDETKEEEGTGGGRERTNRKQKQTMTTSSTNDQEGTGDKAKRHANNCWLNCGLFCFKFKQNTKIQLLEFKIKQRQQQFGVEYLTLIQENKGKPKSAQDEALKKCVQTAKDDLRELKQQVDALDDEMDVAEKETETKKISSPSSK